MNVEDLYRILRADHVQAQSIVDTVADPMLVLDDRLRVLNANRAFFETFKVDREETIGRQIYELGNGQWDIPDLRTLLMQVVPKARAVVDYEVKHAFPGLGERTMLLTARTLFHPDNNSRSLLLTIVDVTERYRREEAKDALFSELRHRIKNLLAVAQSIAHQTPTKGHSAEEYRDAFLGRFAALVQAQDLAFTEQAETGLALLLERVLLPYASSPARTVIVPGPAIKLKPRTIMSLSLVLHELATNAAKYGALSVLGGQVQVSWQIEEANRLRLKWEESGGPQANPPAETGFGTHLIQSTMTYSLGGQVVQDFASEGLRAEMVFPCPRE